VLVAAQGEHELGYAVAQRAQGGDDYGAASGEHLVVIAEGDSTYRHERQRTTGHMRHQA
jgi:hypothetical protein